MTLTLTKIDHADLCHGWSWTITDEDALAERVARVLLGQYRHVAKILSGAKEPGLVATAEQAAAAIKQLAVAKDEDRWHRDGWIFQTISWIAAHQKPAGTLTRAPHIRKADKGFDGLQLELSGDGKSVIAVVIFEDKATAHARATIRDDVWPGISALEHGQRLNELTHEVSALLDTSVRADPEFDVDTAIANILWKEARHYRVSITISDTHNNDDARARLFKGYDEQAPGAVMRRRAETLYLPELRDWMNQFAQRVIAGVKAIAHV